MFEGLSLPKPDSILGLMALYRDDVRPWKADLGVGVYKDVQAKTPIMTAVKEAERRLLEEQTTKTYVGMAGDLQFCRDISELVLGHRFDAERTAAVQAPGGSGALRLLAELVKTCNPTARIWIPDPTWPNHRSLLSSAGVELKVYPYYDSSSAGVDMASILDTLKDACAGDVVLLHACCHNPTGADLTEHEWHQLAWLISSKGLVPLVDIAYQGFGRGLEDDAGGIRIMAATIPEVMVAVSCSKNFSLYCDRVGAAIVTASSTNATNVAAANMAAAARRMYSMPPDHGAAAVRIVLEDAGLRALWRSELEQMRCRIVDLRVALSSALVQMSQGANVAEYRALAHHNGMFSRLELDLPKVEWLRHECAVYIVDGGRINIAGIDAADIGRLAESIVRAKRIAL